MALVAKILAHLNDISSMVYDVQTVSDLVALSEKVSTLHAQITVQRALEPTTHQLQKPMLPPSAQSRLRKFIDSVYDSRDSIKHERLRKLQKFPYEDFIFVGISYTPLEILKMNKTEFGCLIRTIPVYLRRRNLPQRWIFRNEIQVSIASKASLEHTAEFRKGRHILWLVPPVFHISQDITPSSSSKTQKTTNCHPQNAFV